MKLIMKIVRINSCEEIPTHFLIPRATFFRSIILYTYNFNKPRCVKKIIVI
jgi:hypothetical protein